MTEAKPTALVLGGTRGLGRAIAIQLLARGVTPIVFGRTASAAAADPELADAVCQTVNLANAGCADTVIGALDVQRASPTTFYWVAGNYHRGKFAEQSADSVAGMLATHIEGPLSVLAAFHRRAKSQKTPYNLVVIGSVFVHKPGKNHAVLAAAKAFKANFARVFCHELAADLPGSMTMLVNPWAMQTGFFEGYATDPKIYAGFMSPGVLAKQIVDDAHDLPKDAKPPMVEMTYDRSKDGPWVELVGPQPVKY